MLFVDFHSSLIPSLPPPSLPHPSIPPSLLPPSVPSPLPSSNRLAHVLGIFMLSDSPSIDIKTFGSRFSMLWDLLRVSWGLLGSPRVSWGHAGVVRSPPPGYPPTHGGVEVRGKVKTHQNQTLSTRKVILSPSVGFFLVV
jgi:hypothetical protein